MFTVKQRIEKLCQSPSIPYLEDALVILEEFIEEKLDYLRNRHFLRKCFLYSFDAYHTELRENGKMQSISIFVSTGIDLKGYKHILKLFPLSDHQVCFIHLYRNLKNKLTIKSMKEVYKIWQSILYFELLY